MAIYACSSTITAQTVPQITIDPSNLLDDMVLQFDSTLGTFVSRSLSIGGNTVFSSVNTLSNSGVTIISSSTSGVLNFKSITVGSNLTVVDNGTSIEFDIANAGALLNTGSNVGLGAQIYKDTVSNILNFRTLSTGAGNQYLTINQAGDEIEFVNTAEINTASNIGGGAEVFDRKVGENLQFRSITGDNQISANVVGDEIVISADFGLTNSDQGNLLYVDINNQLSSVAPGAIGAVLTQGSTGVEWQTGTAFTRKFKVTFEQTGNIEDVEEIPSDLTVTRVGNQLTVTHPFGTWPKSVSYFGFDGITNTYKLRYPTGNYQVQLPVSGNIETTFTIDVVASVMAADPNGHGYVNLVF